MVLELARHGVTLQRFKGLGEMNAEQLRVTTMAPRVATLKQVTIDDAAMAERIFSDLMGDKVEPRKDFIDKQRQRRGGSSMSRRATRAYDLMEGVGGADGGGTRSAS